MMRAVVMSLSGGRGEGVEQWLWEALDGKGVVELLGIVVGMRNGERRRVWWLVVPVTCPSIRSWNLLLFFYLFYFCVCLDVKTLPIVSTPFLLPLFFSASFPPPPLSSAAR